MGIKTTNIVVTGKTTIAGDNKPVEQATEERKSNLTKRSGTKLVVDGKVKNISKKSAFLLDMLTLDDDQPK